MSELYHPMVAQIVDRCHVGESHREVLRYFQSRLRGKRKGWRKLTREERRQWMRLVFAQHDSNRGIYTSVMRGGR